MIYRASIHEVVVLLDDEMDDERPTPEVAADYIHRCATEVLRIYNELPNDALVTEEEDVD